VECSTAAVTTPWPPRVDPNLEHAGTVLVARVHPTRALTVCVSVLARTARSAMLHLG